MNANQGHPIVDGIFVIFWVWRPGSNNLHSTCYYHSAQKYPISNGFIPFNTDAWNTLNLQYYQPLVISQSTNTISKRPKRPQPNSKPQWWWNSSSPRSFESILSFLSWPNLDFPWPCLNLVPFRLAFWMRGEGGGLSCDLIVIRCCLIVIRYRGWVVAILFDWILLENRIGWS